MVAPWVFGPGSQAQDSTLNAIHEKLGDVPVIFITATPADCQPVNPPGQVLRKPIDRAELAAPFTSWQVELGVSRCQIG